MNRLTEFAGGVKTAWAYDVLNRRTSEKIGSALATTYAYDAADQLISTTQGTVLFDRSWFGWIVLRRCPGFYASNK